MSFACGTGTTANAYKSVTGTTLFSNYTPGWHMFTGTYDGFSTKIYIDGVLENTNAAYTTKTPIYYNSTNGIFIGAEAAGSATTPTTPYFTGKISDVRIYCSALGADDIKNLYESAGSVTKTGALVAYDFDERVESNAKMHKDGIFSSSNFSERGPLINMKTTSLPDGSAWVRIFYHNTY